MSITPQSKPAWATASATSGLAELIQVPTGGWPPAAPSRCLKAIHRGSPRSQDRRAAPVRAPRSVQSELRLQVVRAGDRVEVVRRDLLEAERGVQPARRLHVVERIEQHHRVAGAARLVEQRLREQRARGRSGETPAARRAASSRRRWRSRRRRSAAQRAAGRELAVDQASSSWPSGARSRPAAPASSASKFWKHRSTCRLRAYSRKISRAASISGGRVGDDQANLGGVHPCGGGHGRDEPSLPADDGSPATPTTRSTGRQQHDGQRARDALSSSLAGTSRRQQLVAADHRADQVAAPAQPVDQRSRRRAAATSADQHPLPDVLVIAGERRPVALETNWFSGPVVAISSSANRPVATCGDQEQQHREHRGAAERGVPDVEMLVAARPGRAGSAAASPGRR